MAPHYWTPSTRMVADIDLGRWTFTLCNCVLGQTLGGYLSGLDALGIRFDLDSDSATASTERPAMKTRSSPLPGVS